MGYALRRMWLPQGVATLLWNQWQLCRGMRGNFAMESVASFAWNRWQLSYGTGGNFRAEYALMNPYTIKMSTIMRDSGTLEATENYENVRRIDEALDELKEKKILLSFEKDIVRGKRNCIVDILYRTHL